MSTIKKITTVEDINVKVAGAVDLFTIPTGKQLIVKNVVARCTEFVLGGQTVTPNISLGANDPDYNNVWGSSTPSFSAIDQQAEIIQDGGSSPILNAGQTLKIKVNDPSDATTEKWAVDVFGYYVGESELAGGVYTDIPALEDYLQITIAEADEDKVNGYISAMSNFIDSFCNRNIYRDTEETYVYDGDGSDMILIKDCIDPVVTIDGVTKTVYKYPTNKPYASRIRLGDGYKFTKGLQNVSVTGIQAMNAQLPADIKFACTVLVAGILNASDVQGKVGTTEHIGDYSVTYRDASAKGDFETAKRTLSLYKRIAL